MSTRTYLSSRIDTVPLAAGLAAGDAIALGLFVMIGEIQHGNQPFSNPDVVFEALAPFLLAWLAVAFVGGLFTADSLLSPRRAISWALPAWVLADLIAHGLRASPLFRGNTAFTFLVVSLVAGGLLLIGWRFLAAVGAKHAGG